MSYQVDETHDPKLTSWVESANDSTTDFPIQNLPFGVFRQHGSNEGPRIGVAIGDMVLDVAGCDAEGLFAGAATTAALACLGESLNELMALGPEHWSALRKRLQDILRSDAPDGYKQRAGRNMVAQDNVEMLLPAHVGDYTDFYASIYHATNVGSMFRPDNPLLPNYKYVPIGYHGRASSIVPSGFPVKRPSGQTRDNADQNPVFGPTRRLDYEAEVGFFIGPGNMLGSPLSMEEAARQIFGYCLVNDWSARDVQTWEYQPLGPFLAKNFATTISPWVVTSEALAPFRTGAFERAEGDPWPLDYLRSELDQRAGGLDLNIEVYLSSRAMRDAGTPAMRLSRANFRDMYWTSAQMVAHHASNGCNLRPGDLLASGTVSGNSKDARGCMLELTWRGTEPVALPTGEMRKFLEDGDEVTMRGYAEREGFRRIGLGECKGVIV